jgi:NADP-dependent 3-hydroxy acid dehydrogenase YdfG
VSGFIIGFGQALAEEALKRGDRVVTIARDSERVWELEQDYPERARAVRLDVTDFDEVWDSVKAAI